MKRLGKAQSREGAAYVEAVAVLPVMFALFAGMYLMVDMYNAGFNARAEARTVAWRDSMGATVDADGKPVACGGDPGTQCGLTNDGTPNGNCSEEEAAALLGTDVDALPIAVLAEDGSHGLDALVNCDENADGFCLGSIPFVSDALGALMGEVTEPVGSMAYTKPLYFGGGMRMVRTQYAVLCNTVPISLSALLRTAVADLISAITPDSLEQFGPVQDLINAIRP
ncbi:MAG: hypothetical protein R3A47_00055 [Polyangiales bacterium]